MQVKSKVMKIVDEICNTKSTDCRSLNKKELARKLMDIANIPDNAEIQEIPLDWCRQVEICYLIPGDDKYYSLFAGIGNEGFFHFEIYSIGLLKGNEFEFFDEEIVIKDLLEEKDYF